MKKDDQFHQDMQQYIAVTTIGASTLRKQGASGVIEATQKYLAAVDLSIFRTGNENDFCAVLNAQTERLQTALPAGARNWGAARKALNLFLRDICYNRFLSERHGLAASEDWMEIPLDAVVAGELERLAGRRKLPRWPGLKNLTAAVSGSFQEFAREFAATKGISRVHLDMRVWTARRKGVRGGSDF